MNEGRWTLAAFGLVAAVMIAVPIASVWTMTRPGAPQQGLDGDISRAFLAVGDVSTHPALSPQAVPAVAVILPKGMPEAAVFQKLAVSGFTCATDSDAATCFRTFGNRTCQDDWTVRLIFSNNGAIWSTTAERKTTCL